MIEYLSSLPLLLINSALFGLFTKLADLTDEHGLKWFKGDALLFGILWGIFGALVVMGSPLLGAFYVAILLHWILRGKIDFLNHQIATIIILMAFIFSLQSYTINWYLFISIFIAYSLFGFMRDYKIIKSSWFTNWNIYSYITIGIFIFLDKISWLIFYSYILNTIFYQLAKIFQKNGKRK